MVRHFDNSIVALSKVAMGLVSFLLSEGQPPASPPLIQGQMAGLVGKKVVTAGSEVHSAVTCPPLNLSKLQEIVEDRGTWQGEVHGVAKS